jgi:hypothetical protein
LPQEILSLAKRTSKTGDQREAKYKGAALDSYNEDIYPENFDELLYKTKLSVQADLLE